MIRHIFKIIWNERKTNSWIILEYVLVFCILWFCCDYLYYIGKSYYEPRGFDISNTYTIEMDADLDEVEKLTESENESFALSLTERLKQYAGIEHVCFSYGSMPYSYSTYHGDYFINKDSISQTLRTRHVTSEFFDVFRIKLTKGKFPDDTTPPNTTPIIISPNRNGYFGDATKASYPINKVNVFNNVRTAKEHDEIVIGVAEKLKSTFLEPYEYTMFRIISTHRLYHEITIRINPNAAKGFEERFKSDMKNSLSIGPYTFSDITSIKDMQKEYTKGSGITDNLRSVYSIGLFLIINIFLGIIGTFWYRTESRKSDIGLRMALGSSKRRIKLFLYTETIIILLISAIVGVNICINIGQTDFLSALGIPQANHQDIGAGIEQYFINFGLTFLFLAVISLFAVWYPARQSSNMHPAETLHEE